MLLDTSTPFGEIHPDSSTFKEQIQRIATMIADTIEILKWPDTLRFVTSHPDDRNQTDQIRPEKIHRTNQQVIFENNPGKSYPKQRLVPPTDVPCKCNAWSRHHTNPAASRLWLTGKKDAPRCFHYVAVSYCWPQLDETNPVPSGSYTLYSDSGQKQNDTPDETTRTSAPYGSCIDQKNPDDKEAGVQSMYLVYEQAQWSVGFLSTVIRDEETMDLLDPEYLQCHSCSTHEELSIALRFLQLLDGERWFTRAWCMQESWSAGQRMMLMIRHDDGLSKPATLGDMPGEVLIPFRQLAHIIKFLILLLENHSRTYPVLGLNETWLEHFARKTATVPQYTDENINAAMGSTSRIRCSAAQALHALAPRENRDIVDRIAILANLCDYQVRLDTRKLDSGGISFSTAAYALAVLNGDLSLMDRRPAGDQLSLRWLAADMKVSQDKAAASEVPSAEERLAYSWGPPSGADIANPTWIPEGSHPRRLPTCKVTPEGLEATGYVFGGAALLEFSLVNQEHQAEWDAVKTLTDPVGFQAAHDKVHNKIVWSLVRILIRVHFLPLAQVIWTHENDFVLEVPGNREPIRVPRDITQLIDPDTNAFIFRLPPANVDETEESTAAAISVHVDAEAEFLAALRPSSPRPVGIVSVDRTWLSRTLMTSGRLHCAQQLSTGPLLPEESFMTFGDDNGGAHDETAGHQATHGDPTNPINLRPGVPSYLSSLVSRTGQNPDTPAPRQIITPSQMSQDHSSREVYTAIFEHVGPNGPEPFSYLPLA
ncbi:hypothetical protein LTR78_009299 [Recurvomyces mirabilis]|uniref:Heterokaryon incompatibility domain-containing protein n=1 Tax=Recurvomyces mirabilis TaxID=574656 RepID=A0AAE0WII9_9PEZI|nr:hypothetical protein LTR78_009299 [Recurvomyces mirabilis]KAK5156140.1 hypothetical protein LTS14_005027 [Recurvomyces mirabilis]